MTETNPPNNDLNIDLRNPVLAACLAWLVPGLGHCYQGRIGKALLFFVCIYGVFFFGLAQGGWRNVYYRKDAEEHRWAFYAQLGVGAAALPGVIDALRLRQLLPPSWRDYGKIPTEQEIDAQHLVGKRTDIALIYTIIAGLLNLLAVLDAYAGPALFEEERKYLASGRSDRNAEGAPS